MRLFYTCLSLLLTTSGLTGGEVYVSGYAGGNRSDKLSLYTYSDPVTRRETHIKTIYPGDDGRFSLVIDNEGVNEYFLRNGAHDNHFFIDGSNPVDLVLVPYRPMSPAESGNPLIEYISVHAASTTSNDLNNMISRFESLYLDATNRITSAIMRGAKSNERDSVLNLLIEASPVGEHPFLDSWIAYRIAGLKLSGINDPARRNSILLEVESLFDPANRSCTSFIEDHFSYLLRELASGKDGIVVRGTLVKRTAYDPLAEFASSVTGVNEKSLIEYILISNLYLEYYSNYFNHDDILVALKWFSNYAGTDYGQSLAATISEKIGRFVTGAPLPGFRLKGPGGDIYTPGSWEGRFILLTFGRSDSYTTISEYNLLPRWKEQYGEYLQIVTILCDDDYEKGMSKMKGLGYKWLMLDGSGNKELNLLYEVGFYPAFFLADTEGKIIRAPAPFPSENLMQVFQEKLQPYLLDDIRKRHPCP